MNAEAQTMRSYASKWGLYLTRARKLACKPGTQMPLLFNSKKDADKYIIDFAGTVVHVIPIKIELVGPDDSEIERF